MGLGCDVNGCVVYLQELGASQCYCLYKGRSTSYYGKKKGKGESPFFFHTFNLPLGWECVHDIVRTSTYLGKIPIT